MAISMSDLKRCIWSPSRANVIDFINPETGKTLCFARTLAETRAEPEYADAEEGDWDEIQPKLEAARRAKYVTKPQPITAERYQEMLEVLPPMKLRGGGGAASFMLGEMLTADLTHIQCKIGDRYWSFVDTCHLTHDQIVRKCLEAA